MWCIWRERNNWHFEDLESSVANLKLFFLKTLLDWVTVFGFRSFSSVHGFMDFCSLCTWFVFVLDVYFLDTQVTPLFFLIYSYYLSKKEKRVIVGSLFLPISWKFRFEYFLSSLSLEIDIWLFLLQSYYLFLCLKSYLLLKFLLKPFSYTRSNGQFPANSPLLSIHPNWLQVLLTTQGGVKTNSSTVEIPCYR